MKWIDASKKKPPEDTKVIAWGNPGGNHSWYNTDKHIIFDMYKKKEGWASGWDIRWWAAIEPPEGEEGRP